MGDKIISSTSAAQQAVVKLTGKDISSGGKTVSFSGSNVTCMTDGLDVANQLIGDVASLSESVWKQASKFPSIAESFAIQDREVAHQMGGVSY